VLLVSPVCPSSYMSQDVTRWAGLGNPSTTADAAADAAAAAPTVISRKEAELGKQAYAAVATDGLAASSITASNGILRLEPTLRRLAREERPYVAHVAAGPSIAPGQVRARRRRSCGERRRCGRQRTGRGDSASHCGCRC